MSYNLNAEYDFNNENLETPDLILRDICIQLNDITKKFVQGNVKQFDGPIESYEYDQLSDMASLTANLNGITRMNIQDKLGEIGEDAVLKYEFFLSASQIQNYKYRIMFLEYGIEGYPAKVVLEQGIADELNGREDSGYIYKLETRQEFENLIVQVINSKKVRKVIQDLITVSGKKLKSFESLQSQNM